MNQLETQAFNPSVKGDDRCMQVKSANGSFVRWCIVKDFHEMRSVKMRRKEVVAVVLGIGILLAAVLPVQAADDATYEAVIATAAADYSSGAHSIASVDPVGGPRTIENNLAPTISDITVVPYGKYFYRMERYNGDNIAKYDIDNPGSPLWQFSTMDSADVESSNPHDMVFASARKAYVLRFGSAKAWVVNPSATEESKFKLGELDLTPYADSDGLPEMHSGVIAHGKLFVVLERLDSDNGWVPSNTPYLAVFDVKTNKEIDTGKSSEGLKGIPLPINYPNAICYLKANDTIYVQGIGAWPGSGDPKYEYTGGIAAIDPNTYESRIVVNDGNKRKHPYGAISGMAVVSPSKGYFVGYKGWGDNILYRFNPTTGKVPGKVGQGLSHINITGLDSSGVKRDKNKMLWVCDATNARVVILNTTTNKVDERLKTSLNPIKVVFVKH
jgi:hypothetical protein